MGKYRDYYDTLTLADLRRRPGINAMQTRYAYRRKKIKALIRLQRIYILLSDSIRRRFL